MDKEEKAIDSYINDIFVDGTVVSAVEVISQLKKFGLTMKPPEPMAGGTAVGLTLQRYKTGVLVFRRGNEIPELGVKVNRRELFLMCERQMCHHPTMQRATMSRDEVMVQEFLERVRGGWYVPRLENEGVKVEDTAWI